MFWGKNWKCKHSSWPLPQSCRPLTHSYVSAGKTRKTQHCHLYWCAVALYAFDRGFWMSEMFRWALQPCLSIRHESCWIRSNVLITESFPIFLRSSTVFPQKVRGIPQAAWKDLGRAAGDGMDLAWEWKFCFSGLQLFSQSASVVGAICRDMFYQLPFSYLDSDRYIISVNYTEVVSIITTSKFNQSNVT